MSVIRKPVNIQDHEERIIRIEKYLKLDPEMPTQFETQDVHLVTYHGYLIRRDLSSSGGCLYRALDIEAKPLPILSDGEFNQLLKCQMHIDNYISGKKLSEDRANHSA